MLARALMQKPRLLCLDEPSLGLAPKLVSELYGMLNRVRENGVSILLIEQQARPLFGSETPLATS